VETARKRLELDFHHLELYRNRILPASRDRLAAARGAYEAGRLGFPEVIEAEQALRVAELDMERTVAMSHRNLTALARATGRLGAWIDEGAAR
jgi:outer membrane protein TolC